jgi:hypothetical protein
MTGSLGNLACGGSKGSVLIDGTKVRWLAFTGGSGTVPAIGTTITKGGVSGYLLGVWSDIQTVPKAVGAAMSATGFLKFREVTGGTFSAGALTGITANAAGADVTGWIEVVADQASKISSAPKGPGFVIQGDWFYLGTTSGVRGQIFYCPTTGGTTGTYFSGVQVETAPGSNTYEWWPAISSSKFNTTYVPNNELGKVVYGANSAYISFGAANIGPLRPAGCKVRIPNVILRQCATASRATNTPHSNASYRPTWNTGVYGDTSISKACGDWNLNFMAFKSLSITDSTFDGALNIKHITSAFTCTNVCMTNPTTISDNALTVGLAKSCVIDKVVTAREAGNVHIFMSNQDGATISNTRSFFPTISPTTLVYASNSSNLTFTNNSTVGGYIGLIQSSKISVLNHDSSATSAGQFQSNLTNAISINSCSDVVYDSPTFGGNGLMANAHPYGAVIATSGTKGGIKLRNFGNPTTPLSGGNNATYYPRYLWEPTGGTADNSIKFSRIFISNIGTTSLNTVAAYFALDSTQLFNVGSYNGSFNVIGLENSSIRGVRASVFGGTWSDSAGTHFADYFTSATTGGVMANFGLPSTSSLSQFSTTIDSSNTFAGFDNVGVKLVSVGDSCTYTSQYYAIGHTAFQNSAPTFANTTNIGNHTQEYDLDTGSGFSGTWKTLSGANLSAETISPSVGFKIAIRITCTVADNTNRIGNVSLLTYSTAAAQAANLYPLDVVSLGFTNLIPGSEVRVYQGTNPATATEIGGIESTSGSTFSFTHSSGGQAGVIAIFALGYQPIYLPYTFKTTDDSILIQQVIDRNYVNP